MPRPRLVAPTAALLAVFLAPAALAVTPPFLETFTGNLFSVDTPVFEGGANTTVNAVLANDRLTVSSLGDFNTTRQSINYNVPEAAATPGLSVTQAVDFSILGDFTGVSRLGFVFGVTQPESAGQGPSDAVYTYIAEPSGVFGEDTAFRTLAIDESGSQIDISNRDDPNRLLPLLTGNTFYTLTSTVDFEFNGDITVAMRLIDTATAGSAYDSGDYRFTILAELPPEGEAPLTIDGSYYGLYFRNFESPSSQIVFDNWSLTTAFLPVGGLAGDFNDNGTVEQADLDLVLSNWGAANTPATFLANTDGLTDGVDQDELDAVLGNWGTASAPSFEGFAVPEPASAALLLAGVTVLTRRRTA